MELKDVIHYYIGAKCKIVNDADIWYMTGVENRMFRTEIYAFTQDLHTSFDLDKVTPVLRRIDSLTEEEWRNLNKHPSSYLGKKNSYEERLIELAVGDTFIWDGLLKLHIDLFGLIDAGLAVDEATIK